MASSSYDRVFSNQGINEIAEALGVDVSAINQPGYQYFDEGGGEIYVEAEDFEGTASGIDTSSGPDFGSGPLATVWPVSIINPTTIKTAADGSKTVDVIIEFDAVDNATEYRYRIVPV